jgi:transposase
MLRWSSRHLVFIDESGVNLSQTRAEARAPRGERVVDHVPAHWESYSVIAALRCTGIVAPMVLRGAMNTDALRAWVQDVLAPQLRPGDIVVWDNVGFHTDPEVALALADRGARLEFLPPYSPDLNPIEEAWSKMKSILRVAKARAFDALVHALDSALGAISPADCVGWFKHAGYVTP